MDTIDFHNPRPALLAYHGDPAIKAKYLARMREHRRLDQIAQNYGYWKDGRGCAVGCTIHGESHAAYPIEIGVPEELAHLEDWLFENLPREDAHEWPERFLDAIAVGADLSRVYDYWSAWNLVDPQYGVINYVTDDLPDMQRIARETAADCLAGVRVNQEKELEAARTARAAWAAWAAWAAAVARVLNGSRSGIRPPTPRTAVPTHIAESQESSSVWT